MPHTDQQTNVLYLSYDGMTDPLGQSQVLPYIFGISAAGNYKTTLLSFEKTKRMQQHGAHVKSICEANGVDWQPELFHTRPPVLAKYYDLYNMKRRAFQLYKQKRFKIVHCRSYLSIEIGLALKEKYGCKVVFDMRGFWVDERVDGGLWDLSKSFYRVAYKSYKKKENYYIAHSDYIISLTEAGKHEMKNWNGYKESIPVAVIPCSADFDIFSLKTEEQKKAARKKLGYNNNELVLSYLGSLGTWYLLDEMLDFFKVLKGKYHDAKFLFITSEPEQMIRDRAAAKGIKNEDLKVTFAKRNEVADMAKASDLSMCFIKQAYSKLASSPTKLGELLAMGIPVICNGRIGDVEKIVEMTGGGVVMDECNETAYKEAVEIIPQLLSTSPSEIRKKAMQYYDLHDAVKKYVAVYKTLLK